MLKSLFQTDPLIDRVFLRYMVPSIVGLFLSQAILLIDSVITAHNVGPFGLAAIGMVVPVMYVFKIICAVIGMGCGVMMARFGSRGYRGEAAAVYSISVSLLMLFSVILTGILLLFTPQIAILLGGTRDTTPYIVRYLRIFGLGSVSYMLIFALFYMLIQDNEQKLSMYGIIAGAVVHVASDLFLVYYAHMGIDGIAVGTVIGQFASLALYMLHFRKKDRLMRWSCKGWTFPMLWEALHIGIPDGMGYLMTLMRIWIINWLLISANGTAGGTNGTLLNNLISIMMLLANGIVHPVMPMISVFWAENNTAAIRDTQQAAIRYITMLLLPVTVILFLKPQWYIAMFNLPVDLLPNTVFDIRAVAFYFVAACMVRIILYRCTTSGNPGLSLRAMLFRTALIFIFAYVMGYCWGEKGIWMSYLTVEMILLYWLVKYHGQVGDTMDANTSSANIWTASGELSRENLDLWHRNLVPMCGMHAAAVDEAVFAPLRQLFSGLQGSAPLVRLDLLKTEEGCTVTTYLDNPCSACMEAQSAEYRILTDTNLGLCRRVLWLPEQGWK